ncbi:MAG UNVERIFIED_CONTAM: hypothetical protein LVT10_17020 [Anaerolineae bacterium]
MSNSSVRYAPAPREDAPNITRLPLYGQTNPPPPLITVPAPVAIPRLPLSYPMTKYPIATANLGFPNEVENLHAVHHALLNADRL